MLLSSVELMLRSCPVGTVDGSMPPFETLRPAPPAPPPGGSVVAWLLLAGVLAVVVVAGVILASRH